MPRARVPSKQGPIELEYEVTGRGDPLVLIMGIGAQLIFWDAGFVDRFVRRGFSVIRFDHRDVGLSTRLDALPVPKPGPIVLRTLLGLPIAAPYDLSDMAGDVAGLLDHLGIDRADVVGISMGGMVAQHLTIEHPRRVRSLTSIMSTTGQRPLSPALQPRPSALRALFAPRPKTAEEAGAQVARMFSRIGGVGGVVAPEDQARLRDLGVRAFQRGLSPRGFLRHFAAIAASGDRTPRLRDVRTPTLVIHGREDPLVRVAAGRATARAIPNAKLVEIPKMAHFIPAALFDDLSALITDHARRS